MRLTTRLLPVLCLALLLAAAPAAAQYQPYQQYNTSNRATGETWHVEVSFGFCNPPPDIVVSSKALGIIGSTISAQDDLGMEKRVAVGTQPHAEAGQEAQVPLLLRPDQLHGRDDPAAHDHLQRPGVPGRPAR